MRTLLKIKENKPYSNHTLGIKIGGVSCTLKCQDTVIYDKLQRLYHNFLTDELADVTIELKPVNRLSPEDLSAILSRTRFKHKGNSIRTTSRIMRGQYDLAHHTISITSEGSLIDPDMEFNHLNKLLTAAYYSACKIKYDNRPPAMLVHACGILRY
jgi:hypothetical protein